MKYFNGNFDTRDIVAILLIVATITLAVMGKSIEGIGTLAASVVTFYFKDLQDK